MASETQQRIQANISLFIIIVEFEDFIPNFSSLEKYKNTLFINLCRRLLLQH